jgi:hypothetical protein
MMKQWMTALGALALAGCAAVEVPPAQLASSEGSIRGAEEMGANGVPPAKLHLQLARDQTEEAKKMAASGDERAVLVLARAEADAELALGMAREAKVHAEAQRATEALAALHARANP